MTADTPHLTADQQIRAHALTAAVTRHADVPSWERDSTDAVLVTAERFAEWIEGGAR
jgi:hypothetical protein